MLVVSAALLAAAVFYAGGPERVASLVGWSAQEPVSVPQEPSIEPAAQSPEFARRMYVEQLESKANIGRLVEGELDSLVVRKIAESDSGARIDLVATFKDGTYGDGVMVLMREGGDWYMASLTGLRANETGGFADTVNDADSAEASQSPEASLEMLGMSTFDEGVLEALVAQQADNQEVLGDIVNGNYDSLTFGAPQEGPGTVTVDTMLAGEGSVESEAVVTLIQKEIDGKVRTFITGLTLK